MLKESKHTPLDSEATVSELLSIHKIVKHYTETPDPIKLEVIKNRSQTKFLKAVSEFRAKINWVMHYLHITTETESNIGVLKLPKLKMVVPKVDSVIDKHIEQKLPEMLLKYFDKAKSVKIRSITTYNRAPLTLEVRVNLSNDNYSREEVIYANETWVY